MRTEKRVSNRTHKLYSHGCVALSPRAPWRNLTWLASWDAICVRRLRTQNGKPAFSKSASLYFARPCE